MKISKKFLSIILSLLLVLPLFTITGCADEDVFKIANCEDYIDENLLEEFEEYYEEKTGKRANVEYSTYGTNEDLYSFIKTGDKYDLICTSDYMIEKLARENRLKELDLDEDSTYRKNVSPFIDDILNSVRWGENNEYSLATYSAGYMWGTLGLIYNDKVDEEQMTSWTSLWSTKNKFTIKNSIRDTYFIGLAKNFNEELLVAKEDYESGKISLFEYRALLNGYFNNTQTNVVNDVRNELITLKKRSWGLEVDSGKNDIVTGKIDINFAWSGDAAYAIYQAEENGDSLYYSVPEEGSNMWVDGWCIPKTSNKSDIAKEFINFISRKKSAIANMDYIGYVSCMAGSDNGNDLEYEDYEDIFSYVVDCYQEDEGEYSVDLNYFFGEGDYTINTSALNGQFSAQYPPKEVVDRCVLMNYYDKDANYKITQMWVAVRVA